MTYFLDPAISVAFQGEEFAKADLVRGAQLFLGLNCFQPGQRQAAHTHAGADKFYLVLSGKARMTVGTETHIAGPGTLVWAPADVAHGVDEALERTVLLVGIAPPPGAIVSRPRA
jgi:quercetin dioxygenase-like cupin family protein